MSRSDRVLVAAGGASLLLTAAAVALLLLPVEAAESPDDVASLLVPSASATDATPASTSAAGGGTVVVDVAGAVVRPGLHELAAGARIGDAIAAAGGYGSDADLDAVAASLNLAQLLTDGEQVRVPRLGEGTATVPGGGPVASAPSAGGGATGGMVNLNTATPEELEALPGIGPVTVQKIVAARQERPFTSLDDLVQRGVIHRGQLEDIRELATAG